MKNTIQTIIVNRKKEVAFIMQETEKKYLKWYQKIAYGAGDLASNTSYGLVSSFVLLYLSDTMGLNTGIIGTLMLVSKFLDGISDVIFGNLIDRTKSKLGKARPWMLYAQIGVSLCLVLLFSIPGGMSETAQYAYFFAFYTALNAIFYTANGIAYSALSALITRNNMELYRKAKEIQEKIAQKTASHKNHTKGYPIEENIFDSVLYCGVCGRKMTRTSYVKEYADGGKARLDGYFCLNGGQTKVTVCPESNRISKAELVDILRPLIRMEFAVFLDKPKKYVEFGNERISESVKRAEAKLHETEVKIRRFREEESSVYMDYRAGKILQKDYVAYKMQQEDKLIELRKVEEGQKKDIKTLEKLSGRYLSAIRALLKLKSGKELTKDMVEAFISKIYVYPGKRIEVLFTFTADCMEGVK